MANDDGENGNDKVQGNSAMNTAAEVVGRVLGTVAAKVEAFAAEHPHPMDEARATIAEGGDTLADLGRHGKDRGSRGHREGQGLGRACPGPGEEGQGRGPDVRQEDGSRRPEDDRQHCAESQGRDQEDPQRAEEGGREGPAREKGREEVREEDREEGRQARHAPIGGSRCLGGRRCPARRGEFIGAWNQPRTQTPLEMGTSHARSGRT